MVDRVYQRNATAAPPAAPDAPSEGYPTNGNPAGAIPATIPGAYWYHMITESLRNVIVAAGLDPDHEDLGQVVEALTALAPGQNIAVFGTAGTTEWAVPDLLKAGHRKALVTVKGGGSGAGNHSHAGGGGGSGGGVAHKLVDLTGVESVNITVGDGGKGAPASTSNANGEPGGTSSFGSYCSATGGEGANNWCPGNAGEGIGGDINTSLGPGTPGSYLRDQVGSKGNPGSGGGPGARPQGTGSDGVRGADASLPGGGGGGGTTQGGGGNGAPGEVIVRW